MSLSLALFLPGTSPTLEDHLENLLLLCVGLILVIFVLIVCDALLNGFSKAFEASADWLEHKSARRRRKRAVLRKHYPPLRVVHANQPETSLAHDALRRNAQAHITPQAKPPAREPLRLVKPHRKR